jgi:hypothetical protein
MSDPIQHEVDAVAHFAEAVRELRASPFFIEEYHNLKLSSRQGDPPETIKGGFPDSNVVRAMLIPFRRVWQQRQPCNHAKVVKILKRYYPGSRGLIDAFVFSDSKAHTRGLPYYKNTTLLPSEVINLWLNTKEFHTGKSARDGRYTRQDFDRYEKQFGRVLFEYYFLSSVHEVAISFFNLGRSCEILLREWASKGIKPSFASSLAPSQNIQRTTPGFTPETDAPAHRIWRLKRRRQHAAISNLIQGVPLSDEDLARHIRTIAEFDAFLADLKIACQEVEDIASVDKEHVSCYFGVSDSDEAVWKNRKVRRGAVAMHESGAFFCSGDALPILRDQYLEIREAFLREPFV